MIYARNMAFFLKVSIAFSFVGLIGSVFATYEGSEIERSYPCSHCERVPEDGCSDSHSIYFAKGNPNLDRG